MTLKRDPRSTASCRKIVGGSGAGKMLITTQPINFLSMVEAKTGKITDPKHELFGRSLKKTVLVFPYAIGSSVGAYAIYSLKMSGNAPSAIICSKPDITTASGCAIANIPVVLVSSIEKNFGMFARKGMRLKVDADNGKITPVRV